MSEDTHLTRPAADLARRAPQEWDQFKVAFRAYVDAAKDNLVKANPDGLAKAQGMALQSVALLGIFEDAIAAADRMAARRTTR
mgnify:FL=1